jgi:hypothetical protein
MTPFEGAWIAHEGNSSAVLEYSRVYYSTIVIASQPVRVPFPELSFTASSWLTPIHLLPIVPQKQKNLSQNACRGIAILGHAPPIPALSFVLHSRAKAEVGCGFLSAGRKYYLDW